VKPHWFNPSKENAYFPLPAIGLFTLVGLLMLNEFGGFQRLGWFVVLYCVWCIWTIGLFTTINALLPAIKRVINPNEDERRENVVTLTTLALYVAGAYASLMSVNILYEYW